ncbi:MAG: AsmA family protein [Pigmentiphaga sp.]|nr:AsmA family protein [Pigmentiphaga sp.]
MPRYIKVVLWGCFGLLAIIALLVLILATFNWNHAKPWINRQATELANRQVVIEGDLSVNWLRPEKKQNGWRGWLPWPEIKAQQLIVGNPPEAALDGNMAEISNLTAVVNPLALFAHTIELPRLEIEDANVLLSRNAEGADNWTFTRENPDDSAESKWQFHLEQLRLARARVHVIDVASKLDMQAELDTLPETSQEGYGLGFKAAGTYNDAAIQGEGRTGDILSLRAGSDPFPLQGELSVGETTIGIEGSVTKPQQLAALDVQLKLAGNSMADLYPLIGVALPSTPPYSTEGRLIALLEGDEDTWRYENFKGVVGESDLGGTLEYQRREPRPRLVGEVESQQLLFKDLGPLIGADTSDVKGKKQEAPPQPPAGKVLPVAAIGTEAWGAMDADVKFKGRKIIRGENLPLDNIEAHVKLQDRVLSFTPLNFGVAGGTLSNTLRLDGRSKPMQAKMDTAARHLKLKELFPGAESMNASFGEVQGDARLEGRGNSVAELLSHANGDIKALVSRGTVSHFLLEAAGLNVANMIMAKIFGDEQVILNCVAADLAVQDGIVQIRVFKLETDETTVDITGDINLRDETLDLDIRPANESIRIFTLRSPLYAKGTFQDPDVGVQAGPVAVRAGAALALGVAVGPFAALLPLLNTGTDEANDCKPLVGGAGQKPEENASGNPSDGETEPRHPAELEDTPDGWPQPGP